MTHSSESTTATEADLDLLSERLARPLLRPGEPGYAEASSPWNFAVQQHPLAVAYPQDAAEIQTIVAAAAAAGVSAAVQPRGHGANGSLSDCILIRPDALNELTIDPAARSARVGAGVMWGEVLTALDGTGLAALAGSNSEVSVVGYSLSGGHSAFGRAHGLASSAITALELVDANGQLRRVTAESDPELFWATRGGSGLFGVVTALEFALFPAEGFYGGKLSFPDTSAEAVFRAAIDVLATAPDELTVYVTMMAFPDAPMVPEPIRGTTVVSADVVYIGDAETGEALIAPLRAAGPVVADTITSFSIGQLAAVAAEPTDPSAAHDWTTMLGPLDGGFSDRLIAGFREAAKLGAFMMQLRQLGGALARESTDAVADASAFSAVCFSNAMVFDPAMAAQADASIEPIRAAAAERALPGGIVSMLSSGTELSSAYDAEKLVRLGALKRKLDPAGVFRSNRALP